MTLAPGTRVGAYEIVAPLGAGGMGEVYRAKDTRLGRSAAIKTLPPEFAVDDDRRLRFEREARTLATLNHPHIAQIYGLEDLPAVDGAPPTLALAMELVEGEDLAQRLSRGPVPLDEVWPLARQIAEGLEAAHEAGIVHRDLKPANIRVTPDGVVKVLDFGLAKPMEPVGESRLATHSPTLTSPALTTRGVVLGTASYMAPEQAKGKPVDRRADIWAFGCVLYELLTGRRAFDGEDVPDILGAIIKSEPDWTKLPAATPGRIRTLLARCLTKDRTQRLQHIGDARLEFSNPQAANESAPPTHARTRVPWWWVVAATAAGAVAVVSWNGTQAGAPPAGPPVRAVLDVAVDEQAERPELSPDGRRIAYIAVNPQGSYGVWTYDLASGAASPVAGTEDGRAPFWSPDGSEIGFFADNKLKVVPAAGGPARAVADVQGTSRNGGSWHANGSILFSEDAGRPIFRVPATGGTGEAVTTVTGIAPAATGSTASGDYRPAFLPDGSHFLFWRVAEPWGAYSGGVADRAATLVVPGVSQALFAPPRWLLWVTDEGNLTARPFDPSTRTFDGEPTVISSGVYLDPGSGRIGVSATSNVLAWRSDEPPANQLAIVDRTGRLIRNVGTPGMRQDPQVSDDGRFLVVEADSRLQMNRRKVSVYDLEGDAPARELASGAMDESSAFLSGDGRRLLFATRGRGFPDPTKLWIRALAESGTGRPLRVPGIVDEWTPDGRWVLSTQFEGTGRRVTWATDLEADTSVSLTAAGADMTQGQVAPNGRWVAYSSTDEGGRRTRVFVQGFPGAGARQPVSAGAANQPRWSRDGRELFFRTRDDTLMAVSVTERDEDLRLSEARPLFTLPLAPPNHAGIGTSAQYDTLPNGHFLVNLAVTRQKTSFHVLTNWQALLK